MFTELLKCARRSLRMFSKGVHITTFSLPAFFTAKRPFVFYLVKEDIVLFNGRLRVITPLSGGTEENIFIAQWPFHFYLIKNNTPVILFNGRLVKPKEKAKTPPKMSNQNPIIFNEEETFSNSNEGSNSDKFGIEGDTGSYNQESGINPSSNNGQNVNVNLPQNGYLKPLTPQSNNGQTKQPSIEDGSNINRNDFPSNNDQHSLPAPVHKQPFQQAGQQYSWQFGRPTPRPPFAPSRFGQTTQVVYQRPIGYPRPSNYPHQYEHDY